MTDNNQRIEGFRFSAVSAQIKALGTERLDFALIAADVPAVTAGLTTTNRVVAAPVLITRERLQNGLCQAVLANSGNANACTGQEGKDAALELCAAAARELGIAHELVIPMSTGVIGNPLPVDRMIARIPEMVSGLNELRLTDFARAIITTDTGPKTVVLDGRVSTGPLRIVGVAKGAGMIAPAMATMLAVVLTDMRVEQGFLQESMSAANSESFNIITIDGDTSTNDTLIAMAGGAADAPDLGDSASDRQTLRAMLTEVCRSLAVQIVSDGEGATKLVEIRVTGAPNKAAATKVARTIAESLLVKTAFFGEDPNWGRILAAAGRSGVDFDPDAVDLTIGKVPVLKQGRLVPDWEPRAAAAMKEKIWQVRLDINAGREEAAILTTDLSEEYVRINADYRT